MTDTRHPDQTPAEGSRSTVKRQLQGAGRNDAPGNGERDAPGHAGRPDEEYPAGSLPPFTDPAFSSKPATGAVQPDAPTYTAPPRDTEFAGHPDFSEDAARNRPPEGMGLTEGVDEVEGKTGKSEGVDEKPAS